MAILYMHEYYIKRLLGSITQYTAGIPTVGSDWRDSGPVTSQDIRLDASKVLMTVGFMRRGHNIFLGNSLFFSLLRKTREFCYT